MPRQDTIDFLTAFAVGTALGIGATLLLQPDPTPRERVAKRLKPYRKRMKKSYRLARDAAREGSDATGEMTGEVISAGRELLGEFRSEVAEILDEARAEMQAMLAEQSKGIAKGVEKTRRRLSL